MGGARSTTHTPCGTSGRYRPGVSLSGCGWQRCPTPPRWVWRADQASRLRDPVGLTVEEEGRQVPWEAGPGHRLAMTGMRTLAVDFDCPHHDLWIELRDAEDGIDQLCGGTRHDS